MKTRLLSKFLRKANNVFALGGKRREDLLEIVSVGGVILHGGNLYETYQRGQGQHYFYAIRQ